MLYAITHVQAEGLGHVPTCGVLSLPLNGAYVLVLSSAETQSLGGQGGQPHAQHRAALPAASGSDQVPQLPFQG